MKNSLTNAVLLFLPWRSLGWPVDHSQKESRLPKTVVGRFHAMLSEERYHEIYQGSDTLMKENATEDHMLKLFRAIYTKLGRVQSSTTQSWQVGNHNLVSTVTLVQDTQFEKGKGTEQFVFVIDGEEARLAGYHINSMDLLSE